MDEDDIQLVRRVVKDTVYEILDEEFLFPITELVNGLESGITQFKRSIAQAKGVEKYDPSKIKWEETEGSSGLYQRSEDVNSLDFKLLVKDLASHNGKFTKNGWFYWLFRSGAIVGRKRRGKQKSKASETKPEAGSDPAQFFPEDLRSLLSFEEKADAVIIKPRQFLGSENFAKIADIVKQQGGEYVSAGKNSHFRIPIKSN